MSRRIANTVFYPSAEDSSHVDDDDSVTVVERKLHIENTCREDLH